MRLSSIHTEFPFIQTQKYCWEREGEAANRLNPTYVDDVDNENIDDIQSITIICQPFSLFTPPLLTYEHHPLIMVYPYVLRMRSRATPLQWSIEWREKSSSEIKRKSVDIFDNYRITRIFMHNHETSSHTHSHTYIVNVSTFYLLYLLLLLLSGVPFVAAAAFVVLLCI